MRAAGSIAWLLLSLSLCSTDISTTLETTATTSKSVTTANPTTANITTVVTTTPTTAPQTTTTAEATTLAKTPAFTQSTQLTIGAATTTKTALAATTNKLEPTPSPTTAGAKSLFTSAAPAAPAAPAVAAAPASTPAGHHPTGTHSLPVATTTSQSKTTPQATPSATDKSPVQTATKFPSPHPSGVSNLPSADYSSKGSTLSTGTLTSSQTTEQTSTKIIPNVVTKNQQESLSGTRAGSTELTPEAETTMKTNLAFTTSSQTKAGPPDAGSFQSTAGTTVLSTTTTSLDQQKKFTYSLLGAQETGDEKRFPELCQKLMLNLVNGSCTLTWRSIKNKVHFDSVEINGQVKTTLAEQYYGEMTEADAPKTDYKTLIAILASCGALLIMIIILTVCASHHRKPCNENQQYLTEELHTVENCYHDNPTLEVMEAQPEMQEKKVALNGEFNDSWIVPIDNLMKDDALDEEDTHL